MSQRTRNIVLAVGAVALVAVLLLTVLRKRWWVDRIRAKWVMNTFSWDDEFRRWIPEVIDYQNNAMHRYQLADLIRAYFQGEPGWYLQGAEPPPLPANIPLGSGPLGVGIVRT